MPTLKELADCKHDILDKTNGISVQYEARNLDNFLTELSVKHGFDSVAMLISNHIKTQIWDGRYSRDVKDWAGNYPEITMPENLNSMAAERKRRDYTLDSTHPVIVNFACRWVMENEKNKDNFKPKTEEDKPSPFSQLYDKMSAEQAQYRAWLLKQSPEEILKHSHEYTVREDTLRFFVENVVTDKQAKALLKSPTPLADIYKEICHRSTYSFEDEIYATIKDRADNSINKFNEITQDTIDIKG